MKIIPYVMSIICLSALCGCAQKNESAESVYNGLITVSATHLSKESEKNTVAATRNYGENKMLIVTGKVVGVQMFDGHPIVELEGAKDFGSRNVKCIYPKNRINTVASLSKGQTVAVIGTCKFDYGIIELTVKP